MEIHSTDIAFHIAYSKHAWLKLIKPKALFPDEIYIQIKMSETEKERDGECRDELKKKVRTHTPFGEHAVWASIENWTPKQGKCKLNKRIKWAK